MSTPIQNDNLPICVAALYCFARLDGLEQRRASLQRLCDDQGIKGTLLIAAEGINGTIGGSSEAIGCVLDQIRTLPGCADLDVKFSTAAAMPFYRMKVRIKREIVTLGRPDVDPTANAGIYVEPEDWNDMIDDPDTIVIDTRNDYEVEIGSFAGSIDPRTSSFREFPDCSAASARSCLGPENRPGSPCSAPAASAVRRPPHT